jgi:hypothetical protein
MGHEVLFNNDSLVAPMGKSPTAFFQSGFRSHSMIKIAAGGVFPVVEHGDHADEK